ncbi:MAG: hypothetical protein ABI035_02820 [Gemmatimonadaceae bacterium]
MPIHLIKGFELIVALLAPVVATVYFNRRSLAAASREDKGQVR